MDPTTLTAALAQCRAHDHAGWKALYDAHFDFVYRAAQRLGLPEAEIEDVVHEVFLAAFKKLEHFQEGSFAAWLYRICAFEVSKRHRRRRLTQALQVFKVWVHGPPPETADRIRERVSAQSAVQNIMAQMSAKKREVLAMYELEGLSGKEIATRLGCPEDTVWTRLYHARMQFDRLRRKLGYAEAQESP
jgi:RNA polymerase sigma-70 factor (ECF subfamily)